MKFMQWARQSLDNVLEDVTNINHAYTTHNDLCSVFLGRTLLAIKVIIVALMSHLLLMDHHHRHQKAPP